MYSEREREREREKLDRPPDVMGIVDNSFVRAVSMPDHNFLSDTVNPQTKNRGRFAHELFTNHTSMSVSPSRYAGPPLDTQRPLLFLPGRMSCGPGARSRLTTEIGPPDPNLSPR